MKKEIWEKLQAKINSITPEEMQEWHEEYERKNPPPPKGWISIEDHLPQILVKDFIEGRPTIYKVKDKNGKEFEIGQGGDALVWKYMYAEPLGITHWFNK